MYWSAEHYSRIEFISVHTLKTLFLQVCHVEVMSWCQQTVLTASYMPHVVEICYYSLSPCLVSLHPVISTLLLNLQTLHKYHSDKSIVWAQCWASLYDFKHVLKYYILCAYCFSIKVQCRAETISLRIENESFEDVYETLKAALSRLPASHICWFLHLM